MPGPPPLPPYPGLLKDIRKRLPAEKLRKPHASSAALPGVKSKEVLPELGNRSSLRKLSETTAHKQIVEALTMGTPTTVAPTPSVVFGGAGPSSGLPVKKSASLPSRSKSSVREVVLQHLLIAEEEYGPDLVDVLLGLGEQGLREQHTWIPYHRFCIDAGDVKVRVPSRRCS